MSDFGTFFLPGPTEVRREVLEAMLAPMLPHRGAVFEALFARIQDGLRPIFRTTRPVYVSSSSATGLMEAAIRCAAPGPILSMVNGAFSERFANIARACDRETHVIGGDWHQAVSLDVVERALREQKFAAITVVHSETSTGTLTSLPELAALAHEYGVAVLVDSVTGLAGMPVETDAWDLDFVLTGSQKALALPPGLAFGVASKRYIEQAANATARGLYFDLVEFEEFVHKNQTPSTPAISLLYATAVQGEYIARETIEARWARHTEMANMTHSWVRQLREDTGQAFCVYAPEHARSGTVTAVALPATLNGDDIVKGVAKRGFVIGSGYGKLKSSTFRIGHMGDHTPDRLALCLEATADTIRELLAK
ncbi:alanine--glyoxylate aminotransferase family protein [Gemmatimonas sp.]|uniref:pyridoxal-phosphate-dependent aminotransferase family protein n=3 Tax=Gemmatimonas sp. TaxID=1962908 RepID=UPI0035681F35